MKEINKLKKRLVVELDSETHNKIRALAAKNNISMSKWLLIAIVNAFNKEKIINE